METHSLSLKIDAAPAQAGAKQFTAAIAAVRKAVQDLERDSSGAFVALKNISPKVDVTGLRAAAREANSLATAQTKAESASTRAAAAIQRTALSAAAALRTSEGEAARLAARLGNLGDTASVDRLNADLAKLRANLINAQTPLDVRGARSGFANTSAELSRNAAALSKNAAAEIAAARAAETRAASLDTLRSKYNPLFSASTQYAAALDEIAMAEREGVITSQLAAQARERAAQSMLAASAANETLTGTSRVSGAAVANLGYQFNDIGVMLAAGQSPLMLAVQQGTQVSQVLNGLGGGKAALSAVASGFMAMISPISLVTVGVIAAGAALFYWLTSAGEETKSFTDRLGDANTAISAVRSATETLAGATLGSLADGYGRVNEELRVHLERLTQIANIEAINTTRDLINSIEDSLTGGFLTTDVDDLRIAFDTTNDAARNLLSQMDTIRQAKTFDDQLAAVTKLRTTVESMTGGLGKADGAAQRVLIQLIRSEDAALKLKAATDGTAGAASRAAGAASGLSAEIGTAANEAARLVANLGSVPAALAAVGRSVSSQIAAIQSQNKALNLELTTGLSSAAANRRVQLDTVVRDSATSGGPRINFDQVASEYAQITALDAAAKESERLRSAISEQNKPAKSAGGGGGGGSRVSDLTAEQTAVEDLNKSLTERLSTLEAERVALGLVASGQFETAEAAQLMAEAMQIGGGMVDDQTEAMIRQIDAAAALNEELQRVAKDPVKEWMKSVPNWIEAGQQIEMGAINSLKTSISDFIKTGKFDLESLGESVLGVFADIVADKATAEIMNLFGRADGKGLGGLFGGLLSSAGDAPVTGDNGAAVASGGIQAGTSISTAMVQAGQTVSAQIANAMTTGGASVQAGAQNGLTAGAAQVRSAGQAGLAIGAQNVRIAGSTSGQLMGQGVVAGARQGAPILAQGVASGAAGGGGGPLASVGGLGGILGMVLGAFSEGGMSNSPVGFSSMPVAAFRNAPHFSAGTPNTSGIPAVLHDNEAVIPLSKGRKIPVELGDSAGGGTVIHQAQTINISTPDADSFRRSRTQIEAQMATSGARSARKIG